MSLPTDPELVRRCLDGDESAWEVLTARYADLVYGIARRSGLRAADAADAAQEVFLALLRSLSRLRKAERLAAWIAKTARHQAWRQMKRARAATAREQKVARGETAPGRLPAAELAALETEQDVREAFRALGERCRRLLDALFLASKPRPYAEIAKDLGVSVGSIGPTRRRCLEQLKRELGERGFQPPDVSDPGSGTQEG